MSDSPPLPPDALAPSLDDFVRLAEAALKRLPDPFRTPARDVEIRVLDFADEETLDEMGIEDPFELTGLYQGVDLARRSVLDPSPEVSMAFLYRRPLLDEWAERGDIRLAPIIEHVLV